MSGKFSAGQTKEKVFMKIAGEDGSYGSDNDNREPLVEGEPGENIALIRGTMLELVRRDGRDLTARQLTTLLSVYLEDDVHSVTSVARMLNIARPGVTRILDRLVEAGLVSRSEDAQDRRRVLISRTSAGAKFVKDLIAVANQVAAELKRLS